MLREVEKGVGYTIFFDTKREEYCVEITMFESGFKSEQEVFDFLENR